MLTLLRRHRLYIALAVTLLVAGSGAWWIHTERLGHETLEFIATTVSFWIALLALAIAVATYTSIDRVDAVSRMDGNILDNEHYVTSMPELLHNFPHSDPGELKSALFSGMERRLLKRSRSAIEFADTLQYLIDLIVLFPAIFDAAGDELQRAQYNRRMDGLCRRLRDRATRLDEVSQGSSIQIAEAIKLFTGVIAYQRHVADRDFNIPSDLLHVRGPTLRNPVTRTVFHNYVGLYYNKKAMHLIGEHVPGDLLSIAGVRKLYFSRDAIEPMRREKILMYLESACAEFDKAAQACRDDPMWPGFIGYNKARTQFFESVISHRATDWHDTMEIAIAHRSRLNGFIDELAQRGEATDASRSHLQKFFLYQEELARVVMVNLDLGVSAPERPAAYKGLDLVKSSTSDLVRHFCRVEEFPRLGAYQDGILNELPAAAVPEELPAEA